tara:strand:- start:121 stop:330 length:210 start_codon:yes stop_codon:yes gene_type:complete
MNPTVIRRTMDEAMTETFLLFCERCDRRVVERDRIELTITQYEPGASHFDVRHAIRCPTTWRVDSDAKA